MGRDKVAVQIPSQIAHRATMIVDIKRPAVVDFGGVSGKVDFADPVGVNRRKIVLRGSAQIAGW